jgi:hypothetical protein
MWRFWRALPRKGRTAVFQGSWYSLPLLDRVYDRIKNPGLDRAIARNVRFERMLADDGVLLLKFWFHLSKKRQRERLTALEADPQTRWRVTPRDWDFFQYYDRFYRISEDAVRQTNLAWAPWTVIDGSDPQYRVTAVARTLRVTTPSAAVRIMYSVCPQGRGTRPRLAVSPTRPQKLAGMRVEPPPSDERLIGVTPAARAASAEAGERTAAQTSQPLARSRRASAWPV